MMVGIYKITSPSGKVYIGQTWDYSQRISQYKGPHCKSQTKLYNSIKKYGFGSHVIEVVYQLPDDVDQSTLDNYEQLFIDAYKACGFELMNLRDAGSRGKHSVETIQKMRDNNGKWMLGRKLSTETKIKIGKASVGNKYNLGRSPSTETRQKLSEVNKGRVSPFKGGSHSEEFKKDLANRMKGNKNSVGVKWTIDQREKLMAARKNPWNKGRKGLQSHTNEHKEKMSNRMTGEKHPMAKLTSEQFMALKSRYANGERIIDLAKEAPVSYSHLRKILKNKNK